MNKKVMWFGLLVIGLVILSAGYVNAAVYYGYKQSVDVCNADIDNSWEPYPATTGFKTDFFNRYTDYGFFISAPDGIISVSTENCGDCTCMDSDIDDHSGGINDKMGAFAYGYLYTLDALTSATYTVRSYSSENEDWTTMGQFAFFNMQNYQTGSLKYYLTNLPDQDVQWCGGAYITDDNTPSSSTSLSSTCAFASPLQEGLYFVALAVIGEVGENNIYNNNNVQLDSHLTVNTFNYATSGINRIYSGSPRYVITQAPIASEDFNSVFGSHMETTKWLCDLSGGNMLNETPGMESFTYAWYTNAYPGRNNFCCGDDGNDDIGSFVYGTTTYYCDGNTWSTGSTIDECERLIVENGDVFVPYHAFQAEANNPTLPYYLIDTGSLTGSDGCCGDDTQSNIFNLGRDYGYVDLSKANLCYADRNEELEQNTWNWKYASAESFEITPLYFLSGTKNVDFISNGAEWSYCNANPAYSQGFSGNSVAEGESPAAASLETRINCSDAMNVLLSSLGLPGLFTSNPLCGSAITNLCCLETDGNDFVELGDMGLCTLSCYLNGNRVVDSYPELYNCNPTDYDTYSACSSVSSGSSEGISEDCSGGDLSACLGSFFEDSDCEDDIGGVICAPNDYCVNGDMVLSLGYSVPSCCYDSTGSGSALCHPASITINSEESCSADWGGTPYNISIDYCNGDNGPISGLDTIRCCFNDLESLDAFSIIRELYASVSDPPSKFICYNDLRGNHFSQCDYTHDSAIFLDDQDEELHSVGSTPSTLFSFDAMDNVGVTDPLNMLSLSRRAPNTYRSTTPLTLPIQNHPYYISAYDYLEFDLVYPTSKCLLDINITYNSSGTILNRTFSLCKYLTQGEKTNRWSHVKINLSEVGFPLRLLRDNAFVSLEFRDFITMSRDYDILIDNVRFSANISNIYNSPDYYCTGEWLTWISDLDPSNFDINDILTYGPQRSACIAQDSFGWTGQYCCGDDTHSNYGEFYNDTETSCFNGSVISDDKTAAYAAGIEENTIRFEDYKYKGILYSENKFIGCQINLTNPPYSALRVSISGTAPTGTALIDAADVVKTQCAVQGKHYCADSAWRTFEGGFLELKNVPSGVELIEEGFRGS